MIMDEKRRRVVRKGVKFYSQLRGRPMEYMRVLGIIFNIVGLLIIGFCDMKRSNIYPMITAFLFCVCNIWLFAGPIITRLFTR